MLHDKNKDSLNSASSQNNLAGGGRASKQSSFQDHQSLNSNSELTRIRKKRKSHKARNRALAVLGVLVAIFAIVSGAFALYLHSLDSAMGFKSQEDKDSMRAAMLKTNPVEDKSQAFYMLVLGSDARVNDATSRSDVMILLRVDPTKGTITMVSIPRDTKVEIEGHGTQKINAAYAFGGAAGAVTAVSQFAGVPISHYAEVHFDELEQLVDDLGGVWVDVPVSNNQTGASNTGQKLNSGYQLLNGSQALAFARERYGYTRGDFQRADNQKLVAQAIVKQVLDQQPTELPGTIQELAGCVTTDLSVSDIASLAQQFQSTGVTFYSATVPSTTQTIDGVSYTITVQDKWDEMMGLVNQGKDPSTVDQVAAGQSSLSASSDTTGGTAR